MKGLFRNDLYAALSNIKVFAGIMLLLGVFVTAMDNEIPSLIIGYVLLGMVGFSLNGISGLRKESAARWRKYMLTAPVTRSDIVKSHFISQILWLAVGTVFAGTAVALSVMLHGFPFDKNTDLFTLFVAGTGISLFMDAIFFPLFYSGGEERNEVFLVISLLGGIVIIMGLTTLINSLFPGKMTASQVIWGGMLILACAVLAFALSFPLTVAIFKKKEY